MNISEIKEKLNVSELKFKWSENTDGTTSTEWLRYWHNDTRTDIHMHADVNEELQRTKGQCNDLSLQIEQKTTGKGEYTFARIVRFDESDVVVTY